MRLEEHPTVKLFLKRNGSDSQPLHPQVLDSEELRKICLTAGADDAGFVEIDRPALADQTSDLLELMPETRTVVTLAYRLNRHPLQSAAHSAANLEFSHTWKHANESARRIVRELQDKGIRAVNAPAGFPYEADRWSDKMWLTCDKINATEAGLGHMGWNRLVLHPRYGAFTVLGTLLMGAQVTAYDSPLNYNPCLECKLCVSVCPVGAIGNDGHFDFISCYTHNYRERLGGFVNWVENLASSRSVRGYRKKVSDAETVSMWQNLSIGAQTRCDRCVAICPAGEDVVGGYLNDRKRYSDLVKTFRKKDETIYVVPGSDAERHVQSKSPAKQLKRVSNGVRPKSAQAFLRTMPIAFQRNQSEGLNATYHFTFTGEENCTGTAVIHDKRIEIHDGHLGDPDFHLTADARTWVQCLAKEKNMMWAILTRRIRIKGPMKLMLAFAKCFPS